MGDCAEKHLEEQDGTIQGKQLYLRSGVSCCFFRFGTSCTAVDLRTCSNEIEDKGMAFLRALRRVRIDGEGMNNEQSW